MALFKKGQSGNPGGKPTALKALQELARKHYPEAVELAIQIARGNFTTLTEEVFYTGKGKTRKTTRRIRRKQMEVKPETAMVALEFIANRALGKPAQPLTTGPEGDEPIGQITAIEHVVLQLESDSSGQRRITAANFDPRLIEHDPDEVVPPKPNGRAH